ncbi:putative MIZ/SP-RING zinc finger containing protein [Leishmania naiffi]|uniref:MIZ/SP-RING zinc finger containing protein n=1 Tax=Leishmania naiffi TaxID=5678 RepID=A0AAW3BGZ2_9TRYP
MSANTREHVDHAHDVLRGIRRVRTTVQLQEAYDGLLAFLKTTRQQVETQAANSAASGIKGSSGSSKVYLQVPSNPLTEAQAAMSQLRQLSLLCGAFCRRVEHLLRTTYTYADVDDATHHGLATVHVSTYMTQLTEELQRFNTPAVNRFLAAASETSAVSTSPWPVSPVDCVLSYGIGDLFDYRLCRRKRAQTYLQYLLAQPQWSAAAITQVIVSLNETLSTPADPFSVCTGDEAVEATLFVTPLRDPISQTVIRIPARGETCVHLELFDVESFVQATQQRSFSTMDVGAPCPLCSRTVHLSSIRVDAQALEAMRSYERAAAATAVSSTSSAAPSPLTAECALEWNTDTRTVRVVRGGRGASTGASAVGEDQEEPATPLQGARDDAPEVVMKRRRIEIGGHVLYAD